MDNMSVMLEINHELKEQLGPTEKEANYEATVVQLLTHHYGDGIVYLPRGASKDLYKRAVRDGYISEDGYLTAKGKGLLGQRQCVAGAERW